jgi:hypothetical protein
MFASLRQDFEDDGMQGSRRATVNAKYDTLKHEKGVKCFSMFMSALIQTHYVLIA